MNGSGVPRVVVLPHAELAPDGAVVCGTVGMSICEALLAQGIAIEHACGGVGACATCHVVVRKGFESLSEITESEEDLLDRAWGLARTSRLSCQAVLSGNDVTVEVPRYSVNHAKERER
jgi:ferredoxin, 2Fe-2S